jgi:hypothetical protein
MAAYRFAAQIIGRSTGRSATGAAAYRAGIRITDERSGLMHDYGRKSGVLHTEIFTPPGAPEWMSDRARLWNAVEAAEKRKDAQLAREILLNLPHELSDAQRLELVRDFVRSEFVSLGMVADVAIHAPHRQGDDRNYHAHIMLTMRAPTGDGFGPKARDWNTADRLEQWREDWAACQNRALERAGRPERVDHRSLEAQGIDREPEPKLGPVATKMERAGRPSKAGADRRAAKARNARRDELRAAARVIDLALERERRQRKARQAEVRTLRRIEQEKTRFEAWADGKRAALHRAQLDERHAQERSTMARELQAVFERAAHDRYRQTLTDALRVALRRQNRLRGWRGLFYRLSGRAVADLSAIAALRVALAALGPRPRARRAGQAGIAAARLARQHAAATERFEQRIAQARSRREIEGWTPFTVGGAARQGRPSGLPPRNSDPNFSKGAQMQNATAAP